MRKDPTGKNPERLLSIDAYRGFTMLMMVSAGMGMSELLKDPTWRPFADQFTHRDWVGCTFWDLIQPSFMFIVGAAMPFSYANRQAKGQSYGWQLVHALWRAGMLIALGIFLDSFAEGKFYVQFIRVLQQIAIGYLIAFLLLPLGSAVQAMAVVVLLLGHTLAYILYGQHLGQDAWVRGQNFGAFLDNLLRLPLSRGHYVTFNAVSSAATILLGVLAGNLLRSGLTPGRKLALLLVAGVLGLVIGWGAAGGNGWLPWEFTPLVPMIKKLWTSSFAVYAAGWTFLMLALFYFLIEVLDFRLWSFPFMVVGMNSIAMYMAASLLTDKARRAAGLFVDFGEKHTYDLEPAWKPVVLAASAVFIFWLFCLWLYRRRIFFKV